ncbi:DUF1801 domain-containing protein [soil metagenome]
MKERAKELKANATKEQAAKGVLDKIAEMPARDKKIATRIHEIVAEVAPDLYAKTWYGQPAYFRDTKVVVFLQSAAKFDTRYCTLGFSEDANLDEGSMWPTAFAVDTLTDADEKKIAALIKKAAG